MKTSCRIFLSLLLMLCMMGTAVASAEWDSTAFDAAFDSGKLTLEEVVIPNSEGVRWLSMSPKGTYLLGCDGNGTCCLYNLANGTWANVTIDTTGDEFGHLAAIGENLPRSLAFARISWSADERYFIITNFDVFAKTMRGGWGLFIGSTENQSIGAVRTWDADLRNGGATVYQACFAEDDKLYFSLGGAVPKAEVYTLNVLNLATNEENVIAGNRGQGDKTFFAGKPDLLSMADGTLVQIARIGVDMALRAFCVENEEVVTNLYALQEMKYQEMALQQISGNQCLLTYAVVNDEGGLDYRAQLLTVDKTMITPVKDYSELVNAAPSADGRYLLKLNMIGKDEFTLDVECIADGRTVAIPTDFALAEQANYMIQHTFQTANALFDNGMLWCGDKLLLGHEGGARVYNIKAE